MKRKSKIIFVAEDRGGLDALLPVINKIKGFDNFSVKIVLAGGAAEFADKNKIKHSENIDFKIKSDLILLGTSGSDLSVDKRIIQIARESNILTISFVDSWSNYHLRFGKKGQFLPDYILVIDERMKKELETYLTKIKKSAKVVITGSPRFDKIVHSNSGDSVIFYSQPLKGYELKVFKDVVDSLERFRCFRKVILKLHPNEKNVNKFLKIIGESKLDIKIEKNLTVEQLNKRASLVIGIDSMALFIACLMGKKTISYQPGRNEKEDFLASNKYGLSVPAYTKEKLFSILRNIYKKAPVKKELIEKYTKNGSTDKVVNLVKKLLKNN